MKPILFNTEMVKAILEGRKTVTRRLVKNKSNCTVSEPYQVNDILYVRETWQSWSCAECDGYDCEPDNNFYGDYCTEPKYLYKASHDETYKGWKPSIHMPKEAARLFLRVTGVRVERLHDMKLVDYLAEGISNPCDTCKRFPFDECDTCGREGTIGLRFAALWDSTIKADREHYGYTANPYVWVIEFEKLDVNNIKDAMAAEERANE